MELVQVETTISKQKEEEVETNEGKLLISI